MLALDLDVDHYLSEVLPGYCQILRTLGTGPDHVVTVCSILHQFDGRLGADVFELRMGYSPEIGLADILGGLRFLSLLLVLDDGLVFFL